MGTHFSGTKGQTESLDAYIKLIRAADTIISRVYNNPQLEGLTVSQFGVLEAIFHLGPMYQRELGGKILKSSGNITMVVDNLEKRSLVERRRDRADRRYVSVHLTEKGKQLIEKIFPGHVERITQEFSVLSSEQKYELGRLCRALGTGNH